MEINISNLKKKYGDKTAVDISDFNVPESLGAEIYASNPILQRLYRSHSDMEYFFVDIKDCDYYDLRPTPPVLEHYEAVERQTE